MIFENQEAFHLEGEPLKVTNTIQHNITLKDPNKIVFVKPRWTPIHQRPPIETEVTGFLQHDIAEPTTSPHSSPIVLVKKKDKNKWRLAVDFRSLNKETVPMYFPVPNMDEILFNISKSKIYSSMDLRHGFLPIALMLHARPYCAFSCHLGHFSSNACRLDL